MNLTFNVPINSLSLGQTSIAILREVYKANLECCIFPIGPVDLSAQRSDERFEQWINNAIKIAPKAHKRSNRVIKLWHINGSLESFGNKQELLTFHETDTLTDTEINILENQEKVWVSSTFTKNVFEGYGLNNVQYLDLGFDTHNFKKTNSRKYPANVKVIGLGGKFENRKRTGQLLNLLAKKYGNNKDYAIHAAVYNPFLSKEDNERMFLHFVGGKRPFNFPAIPAMPKNEEYNDFLNSCDVFLGMSGGEGRDLPVYQALSLGKKIVGLNAHAYKDYLTEQNSFLVRPNGKAPCYDGMFFRPNEEYSQGNFFTFDENEFMEKLDLALKSPSLEQFNFKTYTDTFNQLFGKV